LLLLAGGAALGILAAILSAKWIDTLLFALRPWDPLIICCATAFLFGTGLVASLLPARRAAA